MKKTYIFLILILSWAGYVYAQPQNFDGGLGAGDLGYIADAPAPGATFTCTVSDIGMIKPNGFIKITLDITHQFAESDLDITLTSPAGTILELFSGDGVTFSANFTNTVFTQTATDNIQDASAPFNGEYLPKESPPGLAKFNSENADGNWILTITDKEALGDGTLNSWSLTFDKNVGNTKPNADFSYSADFLNVFFTDQSANFPSSYAWDFGDGSGTSTSENPNYTYAASGTYNVRLIATNNGGSDTAIKSITVTSPVAVQPALRLAETKVYPNPTKGKLIVEVPGLKKIINAEVMDLIGNKVKRFTLNTPKTELDLGNLPKGIYFIRIYANDKAVIRKIQVTE